MATNGPLIDPGGGGSVRDLWRNVYRKAAQAAEARLAQLLAEHVYHLHGRRAVAVVMDGGGAALTTGARCDLELPWAYQLEAWALYADTPGSAVVDLQAAPTLAAYPAGLAFLCAGTGAVKPTLSGASAARSEDLTGWTTALPRGAVLRVVVDTVADVGRLTLTLHLRAI